MVVNVDMPGEMVLVWILHVARQTANLEQLNSTNNSVAKGLSKRSWAPF